MKKLDGRRRLAVVAAVVVVLVTALVVAGTRSGGDVVGTVDGREVTREELGFYMGLELRSVQNRLHVSGSRSADWQAEVDGAPALHHLQDAAVERLVRDKQVLLLGEEHGLLESADHDAILRRMEQDNAARQAAVDRGEVVYGTVTSRPVEYYASLLTELETELRRVLGAEPGDQLYVTAEEARARYIDEPDSWAANVATYRTRELTLALPEDQDEQQWLVERVRQLWAAGEPLSVVGEDLPGAQIVDSVVDGAEPASLRGPEQDLLGQLHGMRPGDLTEPLQREGRLIVHELVRKEVNEEEALDTYASRIRDTLLAEKFDDLISARTGASDVSIDTAVVRTIDIEELEQ